MQTHRLELSPAPFPVNELIEHMARAREIDRREGILFRQGKGWFQLPGAGHEALAVMAYLLDEKDYLLPYYRDRALMLARGLTTYEMALDYFGKQESSSAGRQLAGFHSSAPLNLISFAAPTGLQCLPAAGLAWACKLRGNSQVVVCTIGDAAIRQGEYYEALCLAEELQLPLIMVLEDNGWGVSTPTEGMNPYRLGVLNTQSIHRVDGRNIFAIHTAASEAIECARSGNGPSVLWMEIDRIQSHSASDDHRLYRTDESIRAMQARDPLASICSNALKPKLAVEVEETYRMAAAADDPDPALARQHTFSSAPLEKFQSDLDGQRESWTMVDAIRSTLSSLLYDDPRVLLFGQDIEDPKGGVFGLTKDLSTQHPGRVRNSALAEATIAGAACGLSLGGYRPVFELQFIDFSGPAFNQIVNQIATMRWRSAGAFSCPLVIMAPCGAYLPAGGPWHSQTNEGWFAHAPGLQVVIPSTPEDAAALLRAAVGGEDPVLYLIPKHLLRVRQPTQNTSACIGQAAVRRSGADVTVIAWGNTVSLALNAAEFLAKHSRPIDCEVLDLRSIVPCDWQAIKQSLAKTGKLVVVQEDNRTCSFGQSIIADVVSNPELWRLLDAQPKLVCRDDVHIGFHPTLEESVLPSTESIIEAVRLIAHGTL
jgi:2-oxoisovalerate dehydrogenase E1 component